MSGEKLPATDMCVMKLPIRYTVKEYYTVAVDGLEQSHIWMPQMVTGFKKKSNFKRRLLQMKNYRKEKGNEICWRCCFKPCAVRFVNNNNFAAAEGFKAGYEKVLMIRR